MIDQLQMRLVGSFYGDMSMKYRKAFEFEVDPKWIRMQSTISTEHALERFAVVRKPANPYELSALVVFVNLNLLAFDTSWLDH